MIHQYTSHLLVLVLVMTKEKAYDVSYSPQHGHSRHLLCYMYQAFSHFQAFFLSL